MTRRWWFRGLLVTAACLAFGCLGATHGEAAAPPARVMAVVSSASGPRLRQLDARTLAPLRGGWSRVVRRRGATALSPLGLRVAVAASGRRLLVLDTATGRIVRTYRLGDDPNGLDWLGGDGLDIARSRPELLVAAFHDCWTNKCDHAYQVVGPEGTSGGVNYTGGVTAALRKGAVLDYDQPTELLFLGSAKVFGRYGDILVELPRMPTGAPYSLVADVAHDRLFSISSAGLVAEIDRIDHSHRAPRVRYHPVGLNGRRFKAAWVGQGRIALWGEDGLGTIDIRTWTTQAIAPHVTGAVATPFGIAAWTDGPADGLTVYRPDGRKRLRVLEGNGSRPPEPSAATSTPTPTDNARYSINLRTGKVSRTLRPDARILVPDLVAIP